MEIEGPLTEEREEKMVSSSGGNPTSRIGRFLRPCADSPEKVASLPLTPLLSETMSQNLTKWPSEVVFKGCEPPQRKWKQWVDRLAKNHEPTWKKAGIYDSIMSSTYEIPMDQELVLGLSEVWCSETNTFVFPWGEATVTLEDTLILGGFSVLGEPVTTPVTEEPMKMIEEDLIAEHKHFNQSRAKKADYLAWINRFMGSKAEGETELEHVAFLALWLSIYSVPSHPESVIGKHVFSVAIHLSMGIRMALAPAVLAGLYKDLRFIYELVYVAKSASFSVCSSFQLLHMWAWERFPLLRPNDSPYPLHPGEPRVGRWQKCYSKSRFKLKLPLVRSILRQRENFEWRPYVSGVNNWRCPSFYKEREELLNYGCLLLDEELQSFVRCLRSCELVGFDNVEQYLPQRVARQFGIDQDLPGHFSRVNANWENAWSSYDRNVRDPRLYIRCRFIEADCTERYFEWWNQSMLVRREVLEKGEMNNFKENLQAETSKMRNREILEKGEMKKNFKENLQAETSKMRNKEQHNRNSRVDHLLGSAPEKATFSKRKRSETKRFTEWRTQNMFGHREASKRRTEEQNNPNSWGDRPPGFPSKKANFSTRKHCDLDEDNEDCKPSVALRKRRRGSALPNTARRRRTARTNRFWRSKALVPVEMDAKSNDEEEEEEETDELMPMWNDVEPLRTIN